jgi:hypothetical protein
MGVALVWMNNQPLFKSLDSQLQANHKHADPEDKMLRI